MKLTSTLACCITASILSLTGYGQPFASRSLNNLTGTAINISLLPQANNSYTLGNAALRWKSIHTSNVQFANGSIQTTAFTPYTAGAGISITGNSIKNTAPDKTVVLTAGAGIHITGTYPNFTVTNTSSQWISNSSSTFCNSGNVGIGTDNPTAKFEVSGGDAKINGISIGRGNSSIESNIAAGQQALYNNISGFSNTVYGNQAMFSNSDGYDNSAIGENALYSNANGIQNTAVGNGTLYYNVSGYGNTATGNGALLNNGAVPNPFSAPEASYNSANGFFSLFYNTTGSYNAGFGTATLNSNTTGSYNTAMGAFSDVAEEKLDNATAVGANTLVNSSNKIRLGDVNVSIVESAAGSWTTSDGRFKTNIREEVPGLSFIKRLRPVLYNFDAAAFDDFLSQHLPDSIKAKRKAAMKKLNALSRANQIVQTGFIAQEVAEAAKEAKYDFNGVHVPESNTDNYSLSYEKMVVPLVKAVQELAAQNEELRKEIEKLKAMAQDKASGPVVTVSSATLSQNTPNPANSNTVIKYSLPANIQSAQLIITGERGEKLKEIILNKETSGAVNINTANMNPGTYQCALYVNGSLVAVKQMLVAR